MRIVTWNMDKGFACKSEHVRRLRPDIAILQEVDEKSLHETGLFPDAPWIGNVGRSGLAAVAFGDWRISRAPVSVNEPWFMPLVATDGIAAVQIIAVQVSTPHRYGAATLNAIAQLGDFIRSAPTLVAGDFNNSVAYDYRKPRGKRFCDVLSALDAHGLTSAWHAYTGEMHGEESAATLYYRRKADRRFHIDYVFLPASARIERVAIGTFEESAQAKISDHAPIVVDFTHAPSPMIAPAEARSDALCDIVPAQPSS
ncbi:endonuclease/exonuclease/phosphatase family protein [Xanthobacter oligotrophicus]|uniref:endonuclease/exonuclease/phosphatase family protein n=1 Tax=Xanthobacter oligotrophicus TaxID=2607286 RepID=UPI0011F14908|nr:endonuclease/exonuclease/phosphatase family protein [Xanthobacter oligotrophicus]MCG5236126.1 endonuclease/exonuclease/phosphatase family protein [Xanthobacter oligotrophicus]